MDLADIHAEWAIHHAANGDGSELMKLLVLGEPLHPKVIAFLRGVVSGKIRIPRRKRAPAAKRMSRNAREELVVRCVDSEMKRHGRRRDRALRTKLTDDFCIIYGTTPGQVDDYLKRSKARRR